MLVGVGRIGERREDRGDWGGGEVHHRSWLTLFERSCVPFVNEGCRWEEGPLEVLWRDGVDDGDDVPRALCKAGSFIMMSMEVFVGF